MNQPGIWIFGSIDGDERAMGMGTIVEYAGQRGEPQWLNPQAANWDYAFFGDAARTPEPDHQFVLAFEKIPGGWGGFNRWTINGKSFPDTDPLPVQAGRRYRLAFHNKSGDAHPIHLHRHTFEITKFRGRSTSGVLKDVINVPRYQNAEVDFVADDPGLSGTYALPLPYAAAPGLRLHDLGEVRIGAKAVTEVTMSRCFRSGVAAGTRLSDGLGRERDGLVEVCDHDSL